MALNVLVLPIITLLAGILILVIPGSLRFLVGGYLIIIGILGLLF